MMRQFDDPDQAVSIAAIFLFIGAALQAPQLLRVLFTDAGTFGSPLFLLLFVIPVIAALLGGYGLLKASAGAGRSRSPPACSASCRRCCSAPAAPSASSACCSAC